MRTLLGVLALLLLLQIPGAAAAAGQATISGTVENLTGGRRPVAGQTVNLTAYVDNAEAEWKNATTDARGRFTFTVPADPTRSYVVNIKYKGGDYDSEPIVFKAGEANKQVVMRVYEPTTDVSILRVNVHHMIVEVGEGVLRVAELMVFTNPTDRTYIGAKERKDGKRETIRLTLPKGAAGVQYMEGLMECCVFAADDGSGMVDTMDVKPGMREIAYNYTIPFSRRDAVIARPLDYPTDRVEVFGNSAARLTVTPLENKPAVTTEQGTYARFSSGALSSGTPVTIRLSDLPLARSSTRKLAVAAFAGIIAAALAYPLLRRGQSRRTAAPTREELITTIATLDERFESGGLPEAEYRTERARQMARLKRIAQAEDGHGR